MICKENLSQTKEISFLEITVLGLFFDENNKAKLVIDNALARKLL